MKKSNFYWIGYYFGLSCILHPTSGRWNLIGYSEGSVIVARNQGTSEEDCMYYPIEEVSFILKRINTFLFASMSKFNWFIKTKALEGYWVFDDNSVTVIFEP